MFFIKYEAIWYGTAEVFQTKIMGACTEEKRRKREEKRTEIEFHNIVSDVMNKEK